MGVIIFCNSCEEAVIENRLNWDKMSKIAEFFIKKVVETNRVEFLYEKKIRSECDLKFWAFFLKD